ncbi:MAG: metal ABC transporter substrate-binding protein [Chloroflexota bacterium]|nr:metal ABC transporter substrate-binding protein [Chloroflexota bacterium]
MLSRKRFARSQILIFILAAFLAACSGGAENASNGSTYHTDLILTQAGDIKVSQLKGDGPLHVVATTSIVADVVANVGREAIELDTIIPRMTDPHGYQLTPGDLRMLHDADVVFINGLGLEESLEQSLSQLPEGIPIVSLSEGTQLREFTLEQTDTDADHDPESHMATGVDPHVWFDPSNIDVWTDNAAQSLSALDPANAATFQANSDTYHNQLEDLHNWILGQLKEIPQADRKLVTDHLFMGYFAQRYDFEIINALLPAFSSAASPSAKELADIQDSIRQSGVDVIFIGITSNRQIAEQIAGDTSVAVVPLYTGSLSEINGPADTYLSFMQYNVRAIANALK